MCPKSTAPPAFGVLILLFINPLLGAAAGEPAGAPRVEWRVFEDPFERALSADVPRGWTVRGGMFRLGTADVRPMLDLTSPDGRNNIRLGDVAIPLYSLPDQPHAREGERYDLGVQAQLTVKPSTSARAAVLPMHCAA